MIKQDTIFVDAMDNEVMQNIQKAVQNSQSEATKVGQEQVLEQGLEYKGPTMDKNESKSDSKRKRTGDVESKSNKFNRAILIASLVGIVALGIGFVTLVNAHEKQELAKQEEHANDLLDFDTESDTEFEYAVYYTAAEKEALRLAGFTGDEIEEFQFFGYNAQDMIAEVEEAKAKQYEEEMAVYLDSSSEEFKDLLSKTWLGQEALEIDSDISSYSYRRETYNLDYEKIPATGCQLFIKVYLDEEKAFFMQMTPDRWLKLKDKGNIVVKLTYTEMKNGSIVLTNMEEIIN